MRATPGTASEPSSATYSSSSDSARSPQGLDLVRSRAAEQQREHARGVPRRLPPLVQRAGAPRSTATSSTCSISRPPRRDHARGAARDRRAGTARRVRVGRSMRPSSSAALPEAVIHGLTCGLAQTARTTRPPGRVTRAISAAARSISGTSMSPEAAEDAVDRVVREGRAPRRPRRRSGRRRGRAPRRARRAASTISGATSVEISSPPGWSRGSAGKPTSPGPAASSSTRCPGCGSSSSTIRADSAAVERAKRSRRRSQPAATLRQASTCAASRRRSMRPRP